VRQDRIYAIAPRKRVQGKMARYFSCLAGLLLSGTLPKTWPLPADLADFAAAALRPLRGQADYVASHHSTTKSSVFARI